MLTPTRRIDPTVDRVLRGTMVGWALAVAALAWPGPALAQIENRLMIPHAEVTVGDANSTIDVLCDHDFDLVGYSLHFVFDGTKIRITKTLKGSSVEDLIPEGFFLWTIESNAVLVGAVFDIANLAQLPRGQGHSLLTVKFDVLAAPGESVDLVFEDDPDPASARKNRLSTACPDPDDPCTPLLPALQNGSVVALFADEITVYAGPDRLGAENETVELTGRAWSPDPLLPLSFRWSRLSGPDLVNPIGESTPSFEFSLPPVDGDQPILIELEVSDTVRSATNLVIVDVVDLDLRQASVAAPASEVLIFDEGRRAVVYAGQIAWDSTEEDATWTGIEFSTIASAGSSASLDFATLYIDRDGDGIPGAGDTELGSGPIDSDSAVLSFQFSEPLMDGDRLDVLLVVDRVDGGFSAGGPWILALLVTLALAGGRPRASPAISTLMGVLAIAVLAVLPLACSSGGGGRGSAPAARPTPEVHFELDASSVVIHGQTTGVSIPVSGGIQTGPTLSF